MKKRGVKNRPKVIDSKFNWKPAPIPSSFVALSIFGFLVSAYFIYPRSFNWGVTFMFLFVIFFIAVMFNMGSSLNTKEAYYFPEHKKEK